MKAIQQLTMGVAISLALALAACRNEPLATQVEPADKPASEPAESKPAAPAPSSNSIAETLPKRLSAEHLPNAIQLHERVISGGQPDGEAAF